MEHCFWLTHPADPVPPNADRVYLGDEICPLTLEPAFLLGVNSLLARGIAVTVVTPLLRQQNLPGFAALLGGLCQPVEIAVNDIGGLLLLRHSSHTPVLGRLFSRQHTDPAIAGFCTPQSPRTVWHGDGITRLTHIQPPSALWRHWQTPWIFSDAALALYRQHSSQPPRIEIDAVTQGFPANAPNADVTVHLSETLAAVCACNKNCSRCPTAAVPAGQTRAGVPLYRRRASLFYCLADGAVPPYVNRIVRRTAAP